MKKYFLTFVILFFFAAVAQAKMVSVSGELVSMRSGPGPDYAVLWELGQGYPLKIIATKGDWLKVTDFENDTGWVHSRVVNREAHLVVKKKVVNIRSGPGKKFKIIRQAQKGVVFRTLDKEGNWVKVKHEEENITGWILRSLLWGW
ncbi:MAG: SH3 domain-containing protein [Desulfobulbaceae bacterium]|nr:SH3 domain-containing protein [Desulfobulbaceae bacterium]